MFTQIIEILSTQALDSNDWEEVPLNTVLSFSNGELLFKAKAHSFEYVETEEQTKFIEKFVNTLKSDVEEENVW